MPWASFGGLPSRNRDLARMERWVADKLATIGRLDDRQTIQAFVRWHHLRRLHDKQSTGELGRGAVRNAKQQTTVATQFLAWLRERNLTLDACRQGDIEEWLATGPGTRRMVEGFLLWATRQGRIHGVKMPPAKRGSLHALTQERRIELVRMLLTDDQLDPGDRVIGSLLLLYAQPVSRITQLKLDDVTVDGADVAIRFDTELVPLPAPLGAVLLTLLERRPNMATAANPRSAWLFPGGMPGGSIHEGTVLQRLRRLGIEVRAGRNATLEQLVQAVPAVVLADMLGYKASTMLRRAGEGATDWATYAATKASRATSPISAR